MWKVLDATLNQQNNNIDEVTTTITNPTWDEVRTMVEKLNDKRNSDISIGGPNNLVIVEFGLTPHECELLAQLQNEDLESR